MSNGTATGGDRTNSTKDGILAKAAKALGDVAEDLTRLKVVTVVGKIVRDGSGGGNKISYSADPGENPQYIVSSIDLVDGDIVQMIDRDLISAEFDWLREMHKEREQQGYKIVQDNIQSVKDLVAAVKEMFED